MNTKEVIATLLSEIRGLQSLTFAARADRTAMLKLIEEVCRRSGVSEIDGKTPTDFYNHWRQVILDADLADLHKTDPEMAGEFQERVDGARERLNKM